MPPTTIDNATKVNLGILITLVGAFTGGAAYLGSMRGEFVQVRQSIDRMEKAFEKLASQAQMDGRDLTGVKAKLLDLERRIEKIEQH